jgi:hypothetical protein
MRWLSPSGSVRVSCVVVVAALTACKGEEAPKPKAARALMSAPAPAPVCHEAEIPASCKSIIELNPATPGAPPPDGTPPDVVIDDCRTVPANTPVTFGNLKIVDGGELVFLDEPGEIELYARSILVQKGGKLRAGAWCQPFGSGGGELTIGLWGGASDDAAPIGCEGECYPADRVGKLCTGDAVDDPCTGTPGTGPASALFEGYDRASKNPERSLKLHGDSNFGRKVFAVSYGGSVELFGSKGVAPELRTDPNAGEAHPRVCETPDAAAQSDPAAWAKHSGASWARLGAHAAETSTKLTLDRPADWAKGDHVVLTTTDWYPSHSELLTLEDDAAGTELTLADATEHAHHGELFEIDPAELSHDPGHENTKVDVRAAVGLLSRSITIRSMGPSFDASAGKPVPFPAPEGCGVGPEGRAANPDCYFGGHVVARQGFGRFQLRGVELYQLGQGGTMGHYPVHFHLAKDTSYTNALVTDSAIWESNTRFVTVHGTHGVEVARNVGYLSLGHGFFIEDGSEIGNSFCYNLGVSARASFREYFAAQQKTSPTYRSIPPILDQVCGPRVEKSDGKVFPCGEDITRRVGSDARTPAMFWIMNADNDFVGNKAVGVHGIGTCYWPLYSTLSGPSRDLTWAEDSYATWNDGGRVAPLRRFRGNSCSSAALAFMTERGAGFPVDSTWEGADNTQLTAIASPRPTPDDDQPKLASNFPAMRRSSAEGGERCSASMKTQHGVESCATTVIDHFTTSFNWAEVNVGSVWLRPFNFVFANSAVTDQLYGGLGFVSGGSPEQALPGQLAITVDSVFVGSTALEGASAASSLGPDVGGAEAKCNGSFCTIDEEGVPYKVGAFQPKRMITIYDGPFYADGNVFWVDERAGTPPVSSVYRRTVQPESQGQMRVVDAGVGWKQANGFYYPPVFGFRRSAFHHGTTRHNVVDQYMSYIYGDGGEQLPKPRSILGQDAFTPIDTMTILNDLDGTLNGLRPKSGPPRSSGLSNNHFYDAPHSVPECNSFGTTTMPFEFASTFIAHLNPDEKGTDPGWAVAKPAVAVYRQYRLPGVTDPKETCETAKGICAGGVQVCNRGSYFMGSSIGQGIGLTMRDGLYYIDTSSPRGDCLGAATAGFRLAQFDGGQTYAVYNLFANSQTKPSYQIYVGDDFDVDEHFRWVRVETHQSGSPSYVVADASGITTKPTVTDGVLTVTLDHGQLKAAFDFPADDPLRCQPLDLCKPDDGQGVCVPQPSLPPGLADAPELAAKICRDWITPTWAERDDGLYLSHCPTGGCLGFAFTLPKGFQPKPYAEVGLELAREYPKDETWDRPLVAADKEACPQPKPWPTLVGQ